MTSYPKGTFYKDGPKQMTNIETAWFLDFDSRLMLSRTQCFGKCPSVHLVVGWIGGIRTVTSPTAEVSVFLLE
jgi:hypothetical protein